MINENTEWDKMNEILKLKNVVENLETMLDVHIIDMHERAITFIKLMVFPDYFLEYYPRIKIIDINLTYNDDTVMVNFTLYGEREKIEMPLEYLWVENFYKEMKNNK
jgi:hypothetical protein